MDFIAPAVIVAIAIATPVLAWYGSNRYFNGRFEEWKKGSEEWRSNVTKRLDSFDVAARATIDENVKLRLFIAEAEIMKLREWKHTKGDPYIGAVDALKIRVDKLEARVSFLKRQ